jgi:hypothetical protein
MAILCSFKQNGIEGMSHWRVAASCYSSVVGSGPSIPNIYSSPVKSTTATKLKEKHNVN